MKKPDQTRIKAALNKERNELLNRIQNFLEGPLVVLGFLWLVLLVIELLWNLNDTLLWLNYGIWAIFIFDFAVKFLLAPDKSTFMKSNVITMFSLIVPAFRIFRVAYVFRAFRGVRAVRGLRLVKVIGSLNRSMRSLSATMGRRGFGYVLVLTIVVVFIGAAGMYAFENGMEKRPQNLPRCFVVDRHAADHDWLRIPAGKPGRPGAVLSFIVIRLCGFRIFYGYFGQLFYGAGRRS